MNVAYNIDCMEYMKTIPDKYFDLAVVDPPYFKGVEKENFYGAKVSKSGVKRLNKPLKNWDIPTEEYLNELTRVSRHQIIWGINYYNFLPGTTGRIVWDKENDTSTFSNCEIASCTQIDSVKIFRYMWNGMLQSNMKEKENRIHPTQKPVALYQWIFKNYAKQGDKILDTHLGSGSSRIAAYDAGLDFVGCEIDKEYFDKQEQRFAEYTAQTSLFGGFLQESMV